MDWLRTLVAVANLGTVKNRLVIMAINAARCSDVQTSSTGANLDHGFHRGEAAASQQDWNRTDVTRFRGAICAHRRTWKARRACGTAITEVEAFMALSSGGGPRNSPAAAAFRRRTATLFGLVAASSRTTAMFRRTTLIKTWGNALVRQRGWPVRIVY